MRGRVAGRGRKHANADLKEQSNSFQFANRHASEAMHPSLLSCVGCEVWGVGGWEWGTATVVPMKPHTK
eukprot:360530-Chlamydomonas_euryale.AAC.4